MNLLLIFLKESNMLLVFLILFLSTFLLLVMIFLPIALIKRNKLYKNKDLFSLLQNTENIKAIAHTLEKIQELPYEKYFYPHYGYMDKIIKALPLTKINNKLDIIASYLVNKNDHIRDRAAEELLKLKWSPRNEHEEIALSIAKKDFMNPVLKNVNAKVYINRYFSDESDISRLRNPVITNQMKNDIINRITKFLQSHYIEICHESNSEVDYAIKFVYSFSNTHKYTVEGGFNQIGIGYTQYFSLDIVDTRISKCIDRIAIEIKPPEKYVTQSSSFSEIWGEELDEKQFTTVSEYILSEILACKCRRLGWFYDKGEPEPEPEPEPESKPIMSVSKSQVLKEKSPVSLIDPDNESKEIIKNMSKSDAIVYCRQKYNISIKEAKAIIDRLFNEDQMNIVQEKTNKEDNLSPISQEEKQILSENINKSFDGKAVDSNIAMEKARELNMLNANGVASALELREKPKKAIIVHGQITCVCKKTLPFKINVYPAFFGGGPPILCPECGARISIVEGISDKIVVIVASIEAVKQIYRSSTISVVLSDCTELVE